MPTQAGSAFTTFLKLRSKFIHCSNEAVGRSGGVRKRWIGSMCLQLFRPIRSQNSLFLCGSLCKLSGQAVAGLGYSTGRASTHTPTLKSTIASPDLPCYGARMARSAREMVDLALALSANARALKEASDTARDHSDILKEMACITRDAAARSFEQSAAPHKRRSDR